MTWLYQNQFPLGLRWRSDKGSRTPCPNRAYSSFVTAMWDALFSRRKQALTKFLLCFLVVYCIRRWQSLNGFTCKKARSASNQPRKSSNATPNHCEQVPWVSVALWERADVVTAGTFLEHVCLAAGCLGWHSPRPRPGWCRCSIGARRNWSLHLGHTTVQGCWMLPRNTGSHRQEMFCCNPSWHFRSWSCQHTGWGVGTSGWPLVWVASVEVCRRL